MSAPPANRPISTTPVRRSARTRNKRLRLILFTATLLAIGAACWFGYPHVTPLTKQWLARRLLPKLRQQIKERNVQQAAATLREARRWAPDDPEVLHASLDFLSSVGGDPRGSISLVRRLQETGAATPDDLVLLGKMHARVGEIAKAREIHDQLPPTVRQQQNGLELQADLLQAAGKNRDANAVRRTALQNAVDDPASLRQLAALDLASNDPARRKAMSERLWQISRTDSPASLTAIELLSKYKELTVPQCDELFQMVEALPTADNCREAARFSMLSARLRLSPQLRDEVITQEIMRWKDRTPAQTVPLVNWLVTEREFSRILRLVPAQTAARYTDLLPAYVDALRGTGKWQELDTFITAGGIDPAFPVQKIRLWQVETQRHLQPDPQRSRQMLLRIYEEAGRGDDPTTTLAAGSLAEQLNQWDLAERCYAAVIAKHANARQALLPRLYQMTAYQHDGPGMLSASAQLLELKPESTQLLSQKLYLQLLLGIDLELAQAQLQSVLQTAAEPTDMQHLLQALAAYREGQLESTLTPLRQVAHPEDFNAGIRAVYAALLKLSGGDAGKVFRLVERIPTALLLPEEKRFLQRAL
jgi:hypothetical protein